MNEFDKMMRENSEKVNIPDGFEDKVENVLGSLPERDIKQTNTKKTGVRLAVILAVVIIFAAMGTFAVRSEANIIDTLKMTLMDIFGNGKESGTGPNKENQANKSSDNDSYGNSSLEMSLAEADIRKEESEAKRDLMIELKETIVDPNGIYALLQITAPSDIELNKDITFDYFAFCEGTNYNSDSTMGGAVSCDFLESTKDRPNVALYVMKLTGSVSNYEGKSIAACMKDLTMMPNSEDREVLVEGMWSVSFMAEKTVRNSIVLADFGDDEEIIFPYITAEAKIVSLTLTPLSISLTSDVSAMPFEELGVSDTTISLSLLMSDGEMLVISPYSETERYITESGESEFDQAEGVSYQKDIYSFAQPVDINKVVGIYVQGVFVPFN